MLPFKRFATLGLLLAVMSLSLHAQQTAANQGPCAMPASLTISGQANMFSDEQEEWLGDVIEKTFRQQFHVIEDPDGYLQKVADRVLAQLPPSKIHYRFFIVDGPELNSFGTAGGRIYLFRRIISFTQNEDELAALLGHEIGHIATHQSAIEISDFMRQVNVLKVGDQQDVVNKWNYLVDNFSKIKVHDNEKQEQVIADRVGLYAMARAGYDPNRAIDFLDRLFQTKRKTGGFWSDLFGRTSSDAKRLREAMHNATAMSKSCIATLPSDSAASFANWQKSLVESKFAVRKEAVSGVLRKTSLNPQLRGDLQSIHFSRDGAYVMAQDESSIFLLTRDPLANLFRIDAPDSSTAKFSPDAKSVVFYDKEFRVEKWDIPTQKRVSVHQITLPMHCMQTTLSPTGDELACMTNELELQIIDVEKNTVAFSRKKFYQPTEFEAYLFELITLLGGPVEWFQMHFSPDGHYFVVGHVNSTLAYDLTTHSEVKLPGKIKHLLAGPFTFLSPDEIAGIEYQGSRREIDLARFPSGDPLGDLPAIGSGEMTAVAKGDYILMRNTGPESSAIGVMDIKTKSSLFGYKAPGFDIYDQWFAGESVGGEIGIFNMGDKKSIAHIRLPDSPLGYPRAVAFSGNGKWLATSGPTRGAIWKLETGERMFYTLGFEGAFFDQDRFVGKFPKHEKLPSRIFQFDPTDNSGKLLYPVSNESADAAAHETFPENFTWQMGELLLSLGPDSNNRRGPLMLHVYDVRTKSKLWEHSLSKTRPEFFHSRAGKTLTMLVADYSAIKAEAKDDPSLDAKLKAIESVQGKKDSYVLRVFDSFTGKDLGAILVDTGNLSFRVTWANTIKDTVLVGDSSNRTLVYSLQSGAQKGKVFGHPRAISNDGTKMLVEGDTGTADLYDIATLASLAHFTFPARIVHADFTADGASLMVLTADQTVYQLKTEAGKENEHTAEAAGAPK